MTGLLEQSPMPYEQAVSVWKASPSVIRGLEEKGMISVESERIWRNPVHTEQQDIIKKELNACQREAVDQILDEWKSETPRPTLRLRCHRAAARGSSILELIEEVLAKGQQVIVLIPEIALTYQTVERFSRRFGSGVSFMHSRLSAGERFDQFELGQKGEISVGGGAALGPVYPISEPGADCH